MIKKIAIIAGLILLTALGVFVNLSVGNTTNEKTLYSATNENIQPVHKQAAEITKSECNPKMWKHWDKKREPVKENTIGIAPTTISSTNGKKTIEIDLYIHDQLTDPAQIEHTAWHECAHAKNYTINSNKVEQLYKESKIAFASCEYYIDECIADAMAEVKMTSEYTPYYQQEFTQEQLDIAERIWESSDKAQHKTKTNGLIWSYVENM